MFILILMNSQPPHSNVEKENLRKLTGLRRDLGWHREVKDQIPKRIDLLARVEK